MKNPLLMIKDLLIEAASNIMKSQDADIQKTGIFRFVCWDHIMGLIFGNIAYWDFLSFTLHIFFLQKKKELQYCQL